MEKDHMWLARARKLIVKSQGQVVMEGNFFSMVNVTSGMPQGTVLGPLPFLTFISEMDHEIHAQQTLQRTISSQGWSAIPRAPPYCNMEK